MGMQEKRLTQLERALQTIIKTRDYCADHGEYPKNTVGPDQCFDDWAADVACDALEIKRRVKDDAVLSVRQLIGILEQVDDKTLPVAVIMHEGEESEELPFRPEYKITVEYPGFVAINVDRDQIRARG